MNQTNLNENDIDSLSALLIDYKLIILYKTILIKNLTFNYFFNNFELKYNYKVFIY